MLVLRWVKLKTIKLARELTVQFLIQTIPNYKDKLYFKLNFHSCPCDLFQDSLLSIMAFP